MAEEFPPVHTSQGHWISSRLENFSAHVRILCPPRRQRVKSLWLTEAWPEFLREGGPRPFKGYHTPRRRSGSEGEISFCKTVQRNRKGIDFSKRATFFMTKYPFFLWKPSKYWTSFTKISDYFRKAILRFELFYGDPINPDKFPRNSISSLRTLSKKFKNGLVKKEMRWKFLKFLAKIDWNLKTM